MRHRPKTPEQIGRFLTARKYRISEQEVEDTIDRVVREYQEASIADMLRRYMPLLHMSVEQLLGMMVQLAIAHADTPTVARWQEEILWWGVGVLALDLDCSAC
jgi:hypothetical protein